MRLKVAWLIDRRRLHLECPSHGQCMLKSDEEFCSREIRRLMEKRRRHEDCVGMNGCLVVGLGSCEGGGKRWRPVVRVLGRRWLICWKRLRAVVDFRETWLVVLGLALLWVWLQKVGEPLSRNDSWRDELMVW